MNLTIGKRTRSISFRVNAGKHVSPNYVTKIYYINGSIIRSELKDNRIPRSSLLPVSEGVEILGFSSGSDLPLVTGELQSQSLIRYWSFLDHS